MAGGCDDSKLTCCSLLIHLFVSFRDRHTFFNTQIFCVPTSRYFLHDSNTNPYGKDSDSNYSTCLWFPTCDILALVGCRYNLHWLFLMFVTAFNSYLFNCTGSVCKSSSLHSYNKIQNELRGPSITVPQILRIIL